MKLSKKNDYLREVRVDPVDEGFLLNSFLLICDKRKVKTVSISNTVEGSIHQYSSPRLQQQTKESVSCRFFPVLYPDSTRRRRRRPCTPKPTQSFFFSYSPCMTSCGHKRVSSHFVNTRSTFFLTPAVFTQLRNWFTKKVVSLEIRFLELTVRAKQDKKVFA